MSNEMFTIRDLVSILVLGGGLAGVWVALERSINRIVGRFDLVDWRLEQLEKYANGNGKAKKPPTVAARKKRLS